ncbi:MAG: hypothetical protein JST19_22165, partial [Bacteroidetes bacterium]|nr:hypothetical protein [Bacteroidota bacterium]
PAQKVELFFAANEANVIRAVQFGTAALFYLFQVPQAGMGMAYVPAGSPKGDPAAHDYQHNRQSAISINGCSSSNS